MKKGMIWFTSTIIIGIMAIALAGCAGTGEKNPVKMERNLLHVGFQMKLADTPDKMKRLKALPQREIFRYEKEGKIHFVYADAEECECVYVGSESAYQRFVNLKRDKKLDQKSGVARGMRTIPSIDMQTWGPWGPFY